MRKRILYGIYIRRQGGQVGLIGVHGGNVDFKTPNSNGFFVQKNREILKSPRSQRLSLIGQFLFFRIASVDDLCFFCEEKLERVSSQKLDKTRSSLNESSLCLFLNSPFHWFFFFISNLKKKNKKTKNKRKEKSLSTIYSKILFKIFFFRMIFREFLQPFFFFRKEFLQPLSF